MACFCCKEVVYLGCYTPCETLTLPIISPQTQTYTFSLNFGGNIVQLESEVIGGARIEFDISELNEFYQFEGVLSVGGVNLRFSDIDGNEYDCLSFKTDKGVKTNYINPLELTIL